MKKGLFLTLMVSAIALVGATPGFAYAPEIGNIPNIIVGDQEDFDGTIDNNFFQFSNAINFLDYVQDQDTATTAIRWSFMEADDTTSISINGKLQLSGAEDPAAPPGAKELTSGGTDFYADFRLEYISPSAGTPPFPSPGVTSGTLFANRLVTLFATDGTNTDSKTITVYGLENGFDGYSVAQATEVLHHTFDATVEGATPLSIDQPGATPNAFSGATTSYSGGRLGLTAPNNSSNYFGYWTGTAGEIPYTANKVYRARWEIATDQATAANVPSARLRITPPGLATIAGMYQFNAAGTNTNVPPVSPNREYAQYFEPPDLTSLQSDSGTAGLSWYFDIIDFGSTIYGSLFLDELTVETLDPPALSTSDISISTFNASEWYIASGSGVYSTWLSPTSSGIGTGTMSWTINVGSSSSTVGVVAVMQNSAATSPPSIPLTAGDLYRAEFHLTVGNAADKDNIPTIRLRLDGEGETSSQLVIDHNGGGVAAPDTTDTQYNVYSVGPSNAGTALNGSLGFDYYAFDSTEGGTVNLTGIDVVSGSQP